MAKDTLSAPIEKILDEAVSQIGIKEDPPDSNHVKYNTWYYGWEVSGSAYPWCVVFLCWLFSMTQEEALFYGGEKTASCTTLYNYHKSQGQAITGDYQPGDVIFFNFDGESSLEHTGICEGYDGVNITTIDGNTAPDQEANGGAVMRRVRDRSYIVGAYRPRYEEEPDMPFTYEDFKEYAARYEAEIGQGPTDDWAKKAWEKATQAGVLDGSRPQSPLKREELALVLERLEEI